MTRLCLSSLALLLALGAGCGEDDANDPIPADSALPDAGAPDSAPADGPSPDAGAPDQAPSPDQGLPPDLAAPDATAGKWKVPACKNIKGLAGIGFGPGEGKTISASTASFPVAKSYTTGLAALSRPNTLVAVWEDVIYRSEDAGCNWTSVGKVMSKGMEVVAGVGDRAWIWQRNTLLLYRLDGKQLTKLTPSGTPSPAVNMLGMMPHPTLRDTVRVGTKGGAIHETTDGGKTWTTVSGGTSTGSSTYVVAFNPRDLDHVMVGSSHKGFSVTSDGGKNWRPSAGLSASGGKVNGFNAVFSPVDSKVIWANAIDLSISGASNGRSIYRSSDGGLNFSKVVTHQQHKDVILTNGGPIYPHASRTGVAYFTFGTCTGSYGTNLYRYDAANMTLTWKNHPFPGFGAVVPSPADPNFLYLAIHGNNDPSCPVSGQ